MPIRPMRRSPFGTVRTMSRHNQKDKPFQFFAQAPKRSVIPRKAKRSTDKPQMRIRPTAMPVSGLPAVQTPWGTRGRPSRVGSTGLQQTPSGLQMARTKPGTAAVGVQPGAVRAAQVPKARAGTPSGPQPVGVQQGVGSSATVTRYVQPQAPETPRMLPVQNPVTPATPKGTGYTSSPVQAPSGGVTPNPVDVGTMAEGANAGNSQGTFGPKGAQLPEWAQAFLGGDSEETAPSAPSEDVEYVPPESDSLWERTPMWVKIAGGLTIAGGVVALATR